MRRRILALGAAIAGLVLAQQGHPLTGTWSGDWGPSATERHQVTLVMNWDGKNVTGLFNPGPDSFPITSVYVDPATWTVRIEAETKDKTHIMAEGKLQDLGSYHRFIAGIWEQGPSPQAMTKGDFKITRD